MSDVKDSDGNSIRVVRRVVADHPSQKEIRNECDPRHRCHKP